jgi:hypothetical protein
VWGIKQAALLNAAAVALGAADAVMLQRGVQPPWRTAAAAAQSHAAPGSQQQRQVVGDQPATEALLSRLGQLLNVSSRGVPQPAAGQAGARAPLSLQPVNATLSAAALQELCHHVRQQVQDPPLWLAPLAPPEPPEGQQEAAADASPVAAGPLVLQYQVVVDAASRQVLGCMPCDTLSRKWYPQLPLVAALHGKKVEQQHQK